MKLIGFSLIRISGIAIVIDYSWLIMLAVLSFITKGFFEQAYPDHSDSFYWVMGGIATILIFLSVLLRELAHSFVARKYGVKISRIRLHFFGSLPDAMSEPQSSRHEFIIALSGWATSVALGFLSFVVCGYFWLTQTTAPVAGIAASVMIANGVLAALHMIPGFPLDGGRILRAILWDRWNNMARATKVVSQIGSSLALFFMIFGILQFLVTQSLFSGLLFIIGLFMKQSSVGNFQSVIQRQALEGVPVLQVMTDTVVTVDWLVPVEELVEHYIYKHQFTHFPVLNRDELVGMVSLVGVKSISRDLWTFKQVRDIMDPVEGVPCVRPADDASEVLKKMAAENVGQMPVMENGNLVGIVTQNDILNLLRIKSDLGTD